MSDTKLSNLPAGSALTGTELFYSVQSGVSVQVTADQMADFMVPPTTGDITGDILTANVRVVPDANDGAALGASGTAFSDVYLASGAVIDYAGGDARITHSTGALAFSVGCTFGGVISPAVDDAAALGSTAKGWSDLYLSSGATINLGDGDIVLTHAADTLYLQGGALQIAGPLNSLQGALQTVSFGGGSTGGSQQYFNYHNIGSDNVNAGDDFSQSYSIGLLVNHAFGGSSAHGGRYASFDALTQTVATASSNLVRFYVASGGQAQANVSDGGTIGGGNEKGKLYGGSHNVALAGTATGFEEIAARYDFVTMTSGTSAKNKFIHLLDYEAQDRVQGTTHDAAICISAQTGATAGGKHGILIGNSSGAHPLASNATILGTTGSSTVANGIDLSGYTISSYAYKSTNFAVTGNGDIGGASLTTAAILTSVPTTLTGTSGTVSSLSQIVNPSGTFTLTLIDPTLAAGRWQYVKTIAGSAVNSASSNVVPLNSASAGTAILSATAGKWAWLQSDGTNWIIMAGN